MLAIKGKEYGDCSDSIHVRTCRQRYKAGLLKCQGTECTEGKINLEIFLIAGFDFNGIRRAEMLRFCCRNSLSSFSFLFLV